MSTPPKATTPDVYRLAERLALAVLVPLAAYDIVATIVRMMRPTVVAWTP